MNERTTEDLQVLVYDQEEFFIRDFHFSSDRMNLSSNISYETLIAMSAPICQCKFMIRLLRLQGASDMF